MEKKYQVYSHDRLHSAPAHKIGAPQKTRAKAEKIMVTEAKKTVKQLKELFPESTYRIKDLYLWEDNEKKSTVQEGRAPICGVRLEGDDYDYFPVVYFSDK